MCGRAPRPPPAWTAAAWAASGAPPRHKGRASGSEALWRGHARTGTRRPGTAGRRAMYHPRPLRCRAAGPGPGPRWAEDLPGAGPGASARDSRRSRARSRATSQRPPGSKQRAPRGQQPSAISPKRGRRSCRRAAPAVKTGSLAEQRVANTPSTWSVPCRTAGAPGCRGPDGRCTAPGSPSSRGPSWRWRSPASPGAAGWPRRTVVGPRDLGGSKRRPQLAGASGQTTSSGRPARQPRVVGGAAPRWPRHSAPAAARRPRRSPRGSAWTCRGPAPPRAATAPCAMCDWLPLRCCCHVPCQRKWFPALRPSTGWCPTH
mmetsp:Transcript_66562/g.210421  ORF Transcript_66562/g.210421 Transcript_66562/m.210421 type:complete len:317 (-) Transcript_66562:79-1029(-)